MTRSVVTGNLTSISCHSGAQFFYNDLYPALSGQSFLSEHGHCQFIFHNVLQPIYSPLLLYIYVHICSSQMIFLFPHAAHAAMCHHTSIRLIDQTFAGPARTAKPQRHLLSSSTPLRFYLSCLFPAPFLHHIDPSLRSTTSTVFISIFISSPIFQFSIYSLSSLTTSSKSVISLRPLTCHMPVMPGLIASLAL